MTSAADTARAKSLGKVAFDSGINCAPCLDRNMMNMLKGREIGDPRTIKEMKAWTTAWTTANLAAAVAS